MSACTHPRGCRALGSTTQVRQGLGMPSQGGEAQGPRDWVDLPKDSPFLFSLGSSF